MRNCNSCVMAPKFAGLDSPSSSSSDGSDFQHDDGGAAVVGKHKSKLNQKKKQHANPKREKRKTKLAAAQERIASLTNLLTKRDVFISDPPDDIAIPSSFDDQKSYLSAVSGVDGAKGADYLAKQQRQGSGTGNTKQFKKRMKKQHEDLLARQLVHLENLCRQHGVPLSDAAPT